MEENNKQEYEYEEFEDTGKVVVTDIPANESKIKKGLKKAWKVAAIGASGILALFAVNKIGENRGRRKTLETLDGYKIKIDTGDDDSIMETKETEETVE